MSVECPTTGFIQNVYDVFYLWWEEYTFLTFFFSIISKRRFNVYLFLFAWKTRHILTNFIFGLNVRNNYGNECDRQTDRRTDAETAALFPRSGSVCGIYCSAQHASTAAAAAAAAAAVVSRSLVRRLFRHYVLIVDKMIQFSTEFIFVRHRTRYAVDRRICQQLRRRWTRPSCSHGTVSRADFRLTVWSHHAKYIL